MENKEKESKRKNEIRECILCEHQIAYYCFKKKKGELAVPISTIPNRICEDYKRDPEYEYY